MICRVTSQTLVIHTFFFASSYCVLLCCNSFFSQESSRLCFLENSRRTRPVYFAFCLEFSLLILFFWPFPHFILPLSPLYYNNSRHPRQKASKVNQFYRSQNLDRCCHGIFLGMISNISLIFKNF